MPNEKEEIQRKLNVAKEKVSTMDAELDRLEKLVDPLNKQILDIENGRQYFRTRMEKLTKILAGL